MITNLLTIIYRVISGMVVLMPLIVNLIMQGGIAMSFIYAPLLSLVALFIAIYYDGKLEKLTQLKISRSRLKLQSKSQPTLPAFSKKMIKKLCC